MSIALFAILGALTNAGAGYWIVFGCYCAWKVLKTIFKLAIANDL